MIRRLQQDRCLFNLYDTDLSILENMLIMLERIFYLHSELKSNASI